MDTCLYVAEGEIEKRFLTELKQIGYIVPGKFCKFNLMQKRVKNSDNIMAKHYSRIICIIDTDCAESVQLDNLKYNIDALTSICEKLEVMVQNKNFEDELKRLMNRSNLLTAFNQKFEGIKDLKKFLSQKISYAKCLDKNRVSLYCQKYQEFEQLWTDRCSKEPSLIFITGKEIWISTLSSNY